METKCCIKCLKVMDILEFQKDGKGGRRARCRYCLSRTNYPTTRKQKYIKGRRRSKDNPMKQRARNAFKTALNRGELIKPNTCQHCKNEFPLSEIHGHHPDYSKPLDVLWLCFSCHKKQHRLVVPATAL